VLFRELLGLEYEVKEKEQATDYTIEFEGKKIFIRDGFFSEHTPKSSYLNKAHIPSTAPEATLPGLREIVIIHGIDHYAESDDFIECGVDLFAGTFFMLSRWEESVSDIRDVHGRFPGTASLAYRSGFIHRPVVDEYAVLLKKWLIRFGVPQKAFKKHAYRLSLQSDVDTALYWQAPSSVFKKIGFQLFRQRSIAGMFQEIGRYLGYLRHGSDPYDTFDHIMDIAERCDVKATFFFPVGGKHQFDNEQTLADKHVFNILAHVLMRGHEAGVHFSYSTADDHALMERQVSQFREKCPFDELMNRQHYLRCSVPETWHAWQKAGVKYDFTMGYPETPGFRCGICHPFTLFDIHQRRMLYVIEHALIAMDVTFKMYLHSTPEQTIDTCKSLIATVQKHNGEFVLLWHNSSFAVDWEGWEETLGDILTNK
jgi:hypothetical protein